MSIALSQKVVYYVVFFILLNLEEASQRWHGIWMYSYGKKASMRYIIEQAFVPMLSMASFWWVLQS